MPFKGVKNIMKHLIIKNPRIDVVDSTDLGVGAMYAEVAEYTKTGNFGNFIRCNITLGQKASLL